MDSAGCTFEFVILMYSRLAVGFVDIHASHHIPFGRLSYLITDMHASDITCDANAAHRYHLQDCNITLVYATSNKSRAGDAN